ncbi:glycosyltransferase family 2 protein [Subsaximicrobium wynnwilliamsii]|uniref:Glycosyltransferase family 2 protein n=1 Tax=Subsaximicrobium wynnwilliamsii TaxID=291179 RepID=A0A5C6ZHD7_9FLAO|nr:glycosyltransferase family A protein [Subsaximicrobium wynnwilliamsii]TXD83340.1 glycosyltransferase family 2 protein [Subsaximicrobium wynnwilliamsii]TXD89123.1 glycosyltransferase family 2 protein [Subsaximicrobium wynnwilliamsii]TXE03364.1 glycosyltransferase family 2 protein [Subsaximicrobium wynnwilliamsii]
MSPLFSIVIPLYNKANEISQTLESVFKQTLKEFEIIIVNDGSTDNSLLEVQKFEDKRISIFTTENKGVSHARNFGIEKAKAPLIAFLDADDLWYPHHLENLKQLYQTYPNCGMYCKAYEKSYLGRHIVAAKFNGLESDFEGIVPDYFENSLIDAIAWTSATAIPKIVFKTYGVFDTNLKSGQDTDLWMRVALNEPIAFSKNISAIHVLTGQEHHLSQSKHRVDRLKLLNKFKEAEKSSKSLKKYMDYNRFSMAIERKCQGDSSTFKQLKAEINLDNLNAKQRLLLKLPKPLLNLLKKSQQQLIGYGLYFSAFR